MNDDGGRRCVPDLDAAFVSCLVRCWAGCPVLGFSEGGAGPLTFLRPLSSLIGAYLPVSSST